MWYLGLLVWLGGAASGAPSVDLGPTNVAKGLVVRSYGDGVNRPVTLGGRACRMIDRDAGGNFLYVQASPRPAMRPALYVIVEYFDQAGDITLEYDAGEGGAYLASPDVTRQREKRQWRSATFILRRPSFGGRQNGDADFRVGTTGALAVARITLTDRQPDGYRPPADPVQLLEARRAAVIAPGMTVIQQWQVHEPVPAGQLADNAYRVARKIGITSLQSYVGWAQLEPEKGRVTYATYDPVVTQIRKHHLKWLPFLITAPYVATPKWFRTEGGVDAVCLEHKQSTPIQSIWNPALRGGVRRFLELFRAHYEPGVIEALNLGISGNWGESLMPAGGGFDMAGQHAHAGWWCGDPYARADLQRWLRARYATTAALNAAWRSSYSGFEAVEPMAPGSAPSRRATVDLVGWYTQSMTAYAEHWVKTAREFYPTLPIYLCTGGDGQPMLGADFGAQARMCARYGAGIRITNQGDDAASNFAITRMVGSATRLYGQYYTTEPGGDNSAWGIAGRVFDATAGGSRGAYFKYLMDAPDQPTMKGIRFMENARRLAPNRPRLTVAAIMPNSSIALDGGVLGTFLARAEKLRDAVDFEFIDENMIADGMLKRFRAVVILSGDTLEQASIAALRKWVAGGGVLMAPAGCLPLRSVGGTAAPWLRGPGQDAARTAAVMPNVRGVALDIGSGSEEALGGAWQAPEGGQAPKTTQNPDPSYRWTGGDCGVTLPVPRGGPVVLRVRLAVPEQTGVGGVLSVNGVAVARVRPGADRWVQAPVPAKAIEGASSARVGFQSPVWVPNPLSDPRSLGMQVFEVQLKVVGAPDKAVVSLGKPADGLAMPPRKAIALAARPLGKGWTVVWPGPWGSYSHLLNAAVHTAAGPWKPIAAPIDAAYDGILASRVGPTVHYYNNTDQAVTRTVTGARRITVPARSIVVVK